MYRQHLRAPRSAHERTSSTTSSTWALNNATLPFTLALAAKGWRQACADDTHLQCGLNVHDGQVACEAVVRSLGLQFTPAASV